MLYRLTPIVLLALCPLLSAQIIYQHEEPARGHGCDATDPLVKYLRPCCSCRPWQPEGVIKVVKDMRPNAPGVSYRRPELLVNYPACTHEHVARPLHLKREQVEAPRTDLPFEEYVVEDGPTLVTANMVLPVYPEKLPGKGQIIIRAYVKPDPKKQPKRAAM